MEVWVRPNRRAILLGAVPPALVALLLAAAAWWVGQSPAWLIAILVVAAAIAAAFALVILLQLSIPRLTYQAGKLHVYVGTRVPARIPAKYVECFFLGQGPSPLGESETRQPETKNLIVRLAEAASEWQHREIKRSIGHWCDGYITLSGMWCEPITPRLVEQLNHRLVVAKRAQRETGNGDG